MTLSKREITQKVKAKAAQFGFDHCGIAKAGRLVEEEKNLEDWLNNGYHGEMSWMENHFDKRLDPSLLVEGSKSVITLLYNYAPKEPLPGAVKIASYAYGNDYHKVIKKKLKQFQNEIKTDITPCEGRFFVDSAPVMERAWAEKSGLGWRGKHSLLINKEHGSFFFIAVLLLDVEMEYDQPFQTDHCGTCTKCIDACPTDAIIQNQVVDATKCISYLTIELKSEIDAQFQGKMENWAFGCDICQEVCPWNRFSLANNEPSFQPNEALVGWSKSDFKDLEKEAFQLIFKHSAVKRTGFDGFMRNLNFIKPKHGESG